MDSEDGFHPARRARRYLLAGVITLIPLWVTWWVFHLVLTRLSSVGAPWVRAMARAVRPYQPTVAQWLLQPWFQYVVAVLLTVLGLYLLGWLATRVVGRRVLDAFDRLIRRIPLVERIYGSTKRLLEAFQQHPGQLQRVVLIPFPSPEMKTIGFITRTMTDPETGGTLASVYVPTTPNPTSGYVEILPIENVVETDWTVDQAISFVISAGSLAPDTVRFGKAPRHGVEAP
ncbi:MAG TPA: DUF502 domain-containing protein [Gammaproteobacteria bacterium]|nr:DUF502 domain-containing protein [Gammaproteobacteria bacterium]